MTHEVKYTDTVLKRWVFKFNTGRIHLEKHMSISWLHFFFSIVADLQVRLRSFY